MRAFGDKTLDAITTEDVQQLKVRLAERSPKTVNNVLTTLSVVLKTAVERGVIERVPCSIRLLARRRVRRASTTSTSTNDSWKQRAANHRRVSPCHLAARRGFDAARVRHSADPATTNARAILKLLQELPLASYQRFLLRSSPPLQLSFARHRFVECVVFLGVHQRDRPTLGREGARQAIVVLLDTYRQVARLADVEGLVATPKNIYVVHDDDDDVIVVRTRSRPIWNFCEGRSRLEMPCLERAHAAFRLARCARESKWLALSERRQRQRGCPSTRARVKPRALAQGISPRSLRSRVEMEAAGVEPASESTPSQESTCVAALECSRLTSKSDPNRQTLVPNRLVAARRSRARRPACFYDIQPRPAGENGVDVATD